MSIYQQRAKELVAEYEERRARAGELRRKIGEITGTATASRGTVKVTVGVQGEVTALEFPTGAYKRMAPKELAETLLATINEAREKAVESVRELMTPELPAGLNFIELLQGKADRVGPAPTEADIPDAVRDYLGRGTQAVNNGRSS